MRKFIILCKYFILKAIQIISPNTLISKRNNPPDYIELDLIDRELIQKILSKRLTMCSSSNLSFTLYACKQVIKEKIQGDFVEVGVWRGGHLVAAGKSFAGTNRKIIGFDSFTGMSRPNSNEYNLRTKKLALTRYIELLNGKGWKSPSALDLENTLAGELKDVTNIRIVPGDIRKTLQAINSLSLSKISVLRIDVDWYDLTLITLEKLYPLVSERGIIIVDDYGSWSGCKLAIEDYFFNNNISYSLFPVDDSARFWVKN